MFNIMLGLFIIFAILSGCGGIFYFARSQNYIASVIYALGALSIFIVFGLKWFTGNTQLGQTPTIQWPPNINTCPDYLTFYNRPSAKGGPPSPSCIDLVGVSRNGKLKKFPSDTSNPPSDSSYYLMLPTLNTSDPSQAAALCQLASSAGLTWEGITNGESCIQQSTTTPLPQSPGATPSCPSSN